jgi:hypothetical protein
MAVMPQSVCSLHSSDHWAGIIIRYELHFWSKKYNSFPLMCLGEFLGLQRVRTFR